MSHKRLRYTAPVNKRTMAWAFFAMLVIAALALCLSGCAYKGGKVVDGSNIAIGITIPGTDWTINAIDYVGGVRVAGNDMTSIVVTNEVDETNRFFGVVETHRHTRMTAEIAPCEKAVDE